MVVLKKLVFDYMNAHPKTSNAGLRKALPGNKSSVLYKYRAEWIHIYLSARVWFDNATFLLKILRENCAVTVALTRQEKKIFQVIVDAVAKGETPTTIAEIVYKDELDEVRQQDPHSPAPESAAKFSLTALTKI